MGVEAWFGVAVCMRWHHLDLWSARLSVIGAGVALLRYPSLGRRSPIQQSTPNQMESGPVEQSKRRQFWNLPWLEHIRAHFVTAPEDTELYRPCMLAEQQLVVEALAVSDSDSDCDKQPAKGDPDQALRTYKYDCVGGTLSVARMYTPDRSKNNAVQLTP